MTHIYENVPHPTQSEPNSMYCMILPAVWASVYVPNVAKALKGAASKVPMDLPSPAMKAASILVFIFDVLPLFHRDNRKKRGYKILS